MADTETFTIEGPEGETDTVELPPVMLELMRDGDEPDAQIIADIVLQAFAQQAHARVHHAEGGVSNEVESANDTLEELFEDRFGISLSEAMGHQH
ncbi:MULTISPECIES: DUF7545 family protein [Halolamina]|uniref:Uncharacterized protein n=1 Tax=Halolamina pelagica TaxID=699431 RepID=A0A1I5QWJ3_9EURY|nr:MULTISPECIES: hypothetical protein [Halolamina]NHX35580.1 hypothetical protein [Halolamina sp. R1-12]SFP50623.1 hypothetical protein SAMN05216277_104126 [Halolamina pelagica]